MSSDRFEHELAMSFNSSLINGRGVLREVVQLTRIKAFASWSEVERTAESDEAANEDLANFVTCSTIDPIEDT
jgi:hypothetical protein